MSKVLSLKESNFQGSDGSTVICWKVELDDKTSPLPCYSSEASKLKIGEPLPEGWEVRKSKNDKDYLAPPKARSGGFGGGGQAAFRNTAEGQRAEQESIWRSVQFQAERSDRRTALMQAVEWSHELDGTAETLVIAENFYGWLRHNLDPAASASATASGARAGGRDTFPTSRAAERPEGGSESRSADVRRDSAVASASSGDRPSPEAYGEGVTGEGERPEPGKLALGHHTPGSGEQSPGSTLGPGDPTSPTDEGGSSGSVGDDVEGVEEAAPAVAPLPLPDPDGPISIETLNRLLEVFHGPGKALSAVRRAGHKLENVGGLTEAQAVELIATALAKAGA